MEGRFVSWAIRVCTDDGEGLMAAMLNVNGKSVRVDVDDDTPLLWVLRDNMALTGTKYGCGTGVCGACTVHIDGEPQYACAIPVSEAVGTKIVTIEGLQTPEGKALHDAWLKLEVSQCGYCQPGQIMTAAALLKKERAPSDELIDETMQYNICRCATYDRIRAAIHEAAEGKV